MSSQYPQSGFGGMGGGERAGVSVEDLTHGLNEWRNIQDVVRLTFRAFHDVLRAQGEAIQRLEEGAASREDTSDLARRIADLNHQMDLRALKSDVHAAFEAHEELLNFGLSQKADATDAPASPPRSPRASLGVSSAELERRVQAMEARLETFATRSALEKASQETRAELAALGRSLRSEGAGPPSRATTTSRLEPAPAPTATATAPAERFALVGGGASDTKADAEQVNRALKQKADIDAVNAALERVELAHRRFATKEELRGKADASELAAIAESKVGLDEVNRALAEVSRELDGKASVAALEASIREQGIVNRGLSSESSVGRWIWKSGRVKSGGSVPWNVESVNTDPQNFRWEPDRAAIHTVAPGLYEVTFGFFTKKKPAVQLLVNGEPVLAAVNSASYVLHHSSGRLTSVGRHPAGNVTGLTLIDFIALPPRAKISVTYSGETGGEGFISLKKL